MKNKILQQNYNRAEKRLSDFVYGLLGRGEEIQKLAFDFLDANLLTAERLIEMQEVLS